MKNLTSYLGIALGSFIFAFGINYFIIANGLAEGGFTGIALIVHYLTGFPAGIIIFLLNAPLLVVGWLRWGKVFVFKTLLGVAAVSLAVDLTQGLALRTHDLLLAALYGGVLSGAGIGLVLRSGATTGGVDIIARLISEKKGISMGKTYFVFDLAVLSVVALLFGLEKALYTLVTVFIFAQVVDRIIEGVDEAKAVIIISQTAETITDKIMKELDRGATIVKGVGGFTKEEKNVLYVVVGRHQLLAVKKIVKELDPKAFVIVNDVHEVLGEGFRTS